MFGLMTVAQVREINVRVLHCREARRFYNCKSF